MHALYAENFGDLLDFVRMVADSEREVVCRSFKAPAAEEGAHVGLEFRVGVRVSGRRNGARHGFPFRDYKLELAVGLYAYRKNRNRPLFYLEFHPRAGARLAVVFFQRPQNGLAVGDVEVVRAVVPNEHRVGVEVYRVEFREAAAYFEPVHYHHCYAVFDVEFAAHGEAGGRQQGIADYEVCDELAHFGVWQGFVVVRQPVELALGCEFFERNRRPRRHVEIPVGELLCDRIRNRIGRVEE